MSNIQVPPVNVLDINAGRHPRVWCPVVFPLDPDVNHVGPRTELVSEFESRTPFQILQDGSAAFILDKADAFQNLRFRLASGPDASSETPAGMRIVDTGNDTLAVLQDGSLITEYCYSDRYVRPFFFPLNEPGGRCVTRSYPMQIIPHETSDHPHHKSLWIAHGDVNGVDNWSEEPGHGYTIHQSIDTLEEGQVLCRFGTTSLWTDAYHVPLLTQHLMATFWRGTGSAYLIDFDIRLIGDQREVDLVFGDTKEGGLLSARVASAIDATRGGVISNVYGGRDEAECWGRHSHWCSYAGIVDNAPCGITIFDHPDSFRSPTTWHVRDYGLMTANPFGYSAFTHGRINGAYTLPAGESMIFKYRVKVHNQLACDRQDSPVYIDYAFPPRARLHAARMHA